MKDIRQSSQFNSFMKDLGWETRSLNKTIIYLKKIPLMGYFTKIPRPDNLIFLPALLKLRKKIKIFKINIALNTQTSDPAYDSQKKYLIKAGFPLNHFPFNPTTTIRINLNNTVENIFSSFNEAKRRAVRRALKNGVTVRKSDDYDAFVRIRKKQYFPFGLLLSKEMKMLWKNFSPKNASLLLAYSKENKPVAGILLLYYEKMAYYWYASALKIGKKLFAPSLLVFEALKLAKKKRNRIFDFEGIVDDRFPKASESWRGFTKFKEGFGGEKVILSENFQL